MITSFAFRIGELDCAAISAGSGLYRAQAFFADVADEDLLPVLARHGILTEKLPTPFNCLLIRHPDALLLIDTGTKAKPLVKHLNQHGVTPDAVTMVLLSHAHLDHFGGARDDDGKPTFASARYFLSQVDYQAVAARLTGLPVECIAPGSDLLDGITTLPAPGHTAGQIALKIDSGGETLLYTADVIAHPIHLEHPDWNISSDADRATAIQTRHTLLNQAADAGWWLFVYHFPFPGLCRIAREGSGWRIVEQRGVAQN